MISKSTKNLTPIFEKFNKLTILVIGDVMLDSYIWGKVERISPEAPVPIVTTHRKEYRLGGAANVAMNLKELGAQPILCSIIGKDEEGKKLTALLKKNKMDVSAIVTSSKKGTTQKTRILSKNQQMLRIDSEQTDELSSNEKAIFFQTIKNKLETIKIDVVIFQDYNKGLLSETLIKKTINECIKKNIPICVDPKRKNFFAYENCTLFKPNLKELKEGLNISINPAEKKSLKDASKILKKKLKNSISLFTLSEHGIFIDNNTENYIHPAHVRNVSDVSGAGDTVISIAALCVALNLDIKTIATLSNIAGGIVCEYVGVVPISKKRLLEESLTYWNA